jgi:serine/threonine protein kinase
VHTEVHDPALPATEMNTPTPGSKAAASPNWPRALVLMDLALSLPAEQRETWLADTARQEPDLAPLLRKLLAAHARVETHEILATLPKVQRDLRAADSGAAGLRVGPFELIEPLGRGGMGSVWRARYADGRLKRDVAVKLPASSDDTTVLATLRERFARERDFLAQLQHPNIARLYDAGVSEQGQPYLAMEYVAGQPIDDYCDAQRLNVKARLRLFLQVLDAVGYAHQQLVLHRDLKPGNVLVDAQGQVRLLDFGVARLLPPEDGTAPRADDPLRTGGTDLTERAGAAFTLGYAAPEQISKGALSTATDVYALGVMLYRLLTGLSPYQPARDTRGALEDAVLLATPAQSSSRTFTADALLARQTNAAGLKRALANDLDVIIGKALKKSAAERYPSINALADDVRRHLAQLPIGARADSWWYRAHLFVLRHRVAVAASSLALVLLLTATGVAIWKAKVAETNARLAEKEADRAKTAQKFFANLFGTADPEKNRNASAVDRKLLDNALVLAERDFASDPRTLGQVLTQLGELYFNLGVPAKVLEVQRKRVALFELTGQASVDELVEAKIMLAQALGRSEVDQDRQQSLPRFHEAHRLAVAKSASDETLVKVLGLIADQLVTEAKPQEAAAYAELAVERAERSLSKTSGVLAFAYQLQGMTANLMGRSDAARQALKKSIAIDATGFGRGPVLQLNTRSSLADVEYSAGQYAESARQALAALEFARNNLGDLGDGLSMLRLRAVMATERTGDIEGAEALVSKLLVSDLNSGDAFRAGRVAFVKGIVATSRGDLAAAAQLFASAKTGLQVNLNWTNSLTVQQATLQLLSKNSEAALALLQPLAEKARTSSGKKTVPVIRAIERSGVALARLGQLDAARVAFNTACQEWRNTLIAGHPDRMRCEAYLVIIDEGLSRSQKAQKLQVQMAELIQTHGARLALVSSLGAAARELESAPMKSDQPGFFPLLN